MTKSFPSSTKRLQITPNHDLFEGLKFLVYFLLQLELNVWLKPVILFVLSVQWLHPRRLFPTGDKQHLRSITKTAAATVTVTKCHLKGKVALFQT